ncbi:Outer arm dynein light chain 1 protein [Abeliophyllum distichum]|uniref:Outer arm dynein light chain 1 protein n=1 Tax=Abeliophyllum distichum TaxID=126358 RepID=A0ABD1ULX0_9LAMI
MISRGVEVKVDTNEKIEYVEKVNVAMRVIDVGRKIVVWWVTGVGMETVVPEIATVCCEEDRSRDGEGRKEAELDNADPCARRLKKKKKKKNQITLGSIENIRAYVSDLSNHRALEQLRRILRLLPSLKVVSVLPQPGRDPTPLYLLPFGRLKILELRGCDLSSSAARGLLELRHTLEKLICHNSTDALRHVFTSRIAEIKDSPQWNRLSFVSCACNGLMLMDESLQLLPAAETLDLSRNKFAKVDNLRKCTELKHLDLGFNNLRSIASFSERWENRNPYKDKKYKKSGNLIQVSCQIVKLILRNNALTTLRGIENLKSLMVGRESSLFCKMLKLDEKRMSPREFWKRQIIVASQQNQPASFGFYSPAKGDADLEHSINTNRKKISRLVSLDSEEQGEQGKIIILACRGVKNYRCYAFRYAGPPDPGVAECH